MDLAFLYSVYWNLFNLSLVWTDSRVPPRGDLGHSPATSYPESGHRTLYCQHARCRGEGETRPNRTWTTIRLFLMPAFLSFSLLCPLLLFSSFLLLLLFSPPFSSAPSLFSLVFLQNTLYILSI